MREVRSGGYLIYDSTWPLARSLMREDITIRRNAVAAIARENSTPSGVRDLAVLHDNGADIQAMDPEIRRLKALYAAQIAQPGMITRKPFTEAMCK